MVAVEGLLRVVVRSLIKRLARLLSLLALISCSVQAVNLPATLTPEATSSPVPSPTPLPTAEPTAVPTETPATEPGAAVPPPVAPQGTEHTVLPGETLLGLALQYKVPIAAIQLRNGFGASTVVRAGQVLDIPPAAEWEGAATFWVVYLVEEGATLSGIAARYGLDLAALRAANNLAGGDLLRIGQSLILPLDVPAEVARIPDPTPIPVPPTSTPEPTETPVPGPTESPAPAAKAPDSSSPTPTGAPTPASVEPPPVDVAGWPGEVFRLINAVRGEYGLGPLVYNETLARAAQLHGQDCQQRGWCGHTGSDGSNVKTRVLRAGYDAAGWAECIVYSSSPQAAVHWWMDEVPPNDAHRRTLLSTWVTEIGIGVVPTGWGNYYFIADFGRPSGQ
jgi:uncharacterized protein YkwD